MTKAAFDNNKYLQMQSAHIRERIAQFGGKLYLEFGGKLYDDNHASRVLPGFRPDSKLRMLLQLKEQVEMVIVINADDYYGVDAYRTIYEELQRLPERGTATMVGYLLKNTVTRYGTVSRGVCHARDGYLTDIHETLKIRLRDDGTIGDEDSGVLLEPDTVVSMNFWGFMPSVFDEMERYFEDFLRRDAGENVKAECLLPNMVGKLLKEGRLSVSVLQSRDRWFGMTYHEDRARVAAELLELHRAGVYPRELR